MLLLAVSASKAAVIDFESAPLGASGPLTIDGFTFSATSFPYSSPGSVGEEGGKRQAWRVGLSIILDDRGRTQQYAAIVSDITARKLEEERILYQANYDQLTGLPNRILFKERLSSSVAMVRRNGWKLAALFVDYGHEDGLTGDTLQAVRGHRYEHPLTSPGEADLTVQVRFGAYRSAFEAEGLAVEPLLPQGEFLGRLGAVERASRLMAANPAQAAMIEAGVARLLAPAGMGGRVQVMGVRSAALEALPGF